LDDAIAGSNVILFRRTGSHFKHATHGAIRRDEAKRAWLGVLFDPVYAAIALYEDHVERDQCILHPHSDFLIASKIKKHSLPVRQPFPEHETAVTLARGVGTFYHESLIAILGDDRYGSQLLSIERS